MTMIQEDFAFISWNGKEYPVDIKHCDQFKKISLGKFSSKSKKFTVALIGSGIRATVQSIDYVDADKNPHGHDVPALLYVSVKDLQDGKDKTRVFAVSDDFSVAKVIARAVVTVNPLYKNQWGGKREGAGRPEAGRKGVTIRMSAEQHETLKRLGGSQAVRDWLKSCYAEKINGEKFVVTLDLSRSYFMDDREIEDLKNQHYSRTSWELEGPYIFETIPEVLEFISGQMDDEIHSDEPDFERLSWLVTVLQSLTDQLKGKE